jgi:hypothetical protein
MHHSIDDLNEIAREEVLYTDKALLRKEAVRLDPQIQAMFDKFWLAVTALGSSVAINQEQYINVHRCLHHSLRTIDRSVPLLSSEELRGIALEDWVSDCQGHSSIDKNHFGLVLLQLADTQVSNKTKPNYLSFLASLYNGITTMESDGTRRLRTETEFADQWYGESITTLSNLAMLADIESLRWNMSTDVANIMLLEDNGHCDEKWIEAAREYLGADKKTRLSLAADNVATTQVVLSFIHKKLHICFDRDDDNGFVNLVQKIERDVNTTMVTAERKRPRSPRPRRG